MTDIIAVISILFSALALYIGHKNNKEFEKYKKTFDKKFESYSDLIALTKPFLNDPALNFKDAKDLAKRFIEKYNNEILPFAPKEIVDAVQEFLYNSWTMVAGSNVQTKALTGIIQAIRKDLNLDALDLEKIEFHTVNESGLKKVYLK